MKTEFLLIISLFLISCGGLSDYSENIPGGYQFVSEAKYVNLIIGKQEIPCNVIGYAYNENYILACQEFNDSECISYTQLLPQITGRNRDKEINFWIIDIKKDSLWGPLNYAEFLKTRRRLDIDKSLRIKVYF